MRRFYAPPENFSGQKVTLGVDESKHLRDALRLRAGEEVFVFDGAGGEFRCKIETAGKGEAVLRIIEKAAPKAPESKLDLTLAVGLLKGEKFDLVVQKACELGVASVVPLETKRADVKIRDAREAEKKLERWRRIALEAAKQSGRARLMQVEAPASFERFLDEAGSSKNAAAGENKKNPALLRPNLPSLIFFSERGGEGFENLPDEGVSEAIAVVGAEGGWEDAEINLARDKGFRIITLGGRILRAETAAVVAAALLQHRLGDLS
jgi:16S rRNA (uracil1498-N3)-methyltransferase